MTAQIKTSLPRLLGLALAVLGTPVQAEASLSQGPLRVEVARVTPSLRISKGLHTTEEVIPLALRAEDPPPAGAASPAPSAAGAEEVKPSSPVEPPSAPPAMAGEQEALLLYRQALFMQSQGNLSDAMRIYERILSQFPGASTASGAAFRIMEINAYQKLMQERAETVAAGKTSPPVKKTPKVNGGRAEFLVSESLLGVYGGILTLTASENYSASAPLIPVLTAGLGLATAYGISNATPISTAQAAQIRTTQLLGVLNVLGLGTAVSLDNLIHNPAQLQLAGLALGSGAAAALHSRLTLTEGQVALMTSGAVWVGYTSIMASTVLMDLQYNMELGAGVTVVAADAAVLAAIGLSRQGKVKLSRGRMAMINLSGILGTALAGGTLVLLEGTGVGIRTKALLLLAGSVGGLAAGYYATQTWDATYNPEVLASSNAASLFAFEEGRLKLGQPIPSLALEQRTVRVEDLDVVTRGLNVRMNLLSGSF